MRARRLLAHGLSALAAAAFTGCATMPGPGSERAFEVSAAWIGGRPAVAWYGGQLAHEAIFLRFADLQGRLSGPALQLTDASRDAYEPSLQELEGDALVAWYEQEAVARGALAPQVAMLARFDATGHRIWQRQLSASDSRGRIPVVRVAAGLVHVAWLEQRGDSLPKLRAATLDGNGQWLRETRDIAGASPDTWNLNAAVDARGALHVVFDNGIRSRARELQWIIAGTGDTALLASADDGSGSVFPDIALDGSRVAITWVDSRDGNDEVYLRCGEWAAAGKPGGFAIDDAATRVTRTAGESMGAYGVWHEAGLELAWIEAKGNHRELWRQGFDRDCRPRSAARHVAGWGEAGIPSLAASPTGLMLAWNGMRGDPATAASRLLLKVWPQRAVSPTAAAR